MSNENELETMRMDPSLLDPSVARLKIILDGEVKTVPLPKRGSVTLGRSVGADIFLDDPSVSRTHARLFVDDIVEIEDLGSANGTQLGGRSLKANERVQVQPGEVIDIGAAMLVVQAPVERGLVKGPKRRSGAGAIRTVELQRPEAPPNAMARLSQLLDRIASSDISVLLLGETGVGKEVFAEKVHARSSRASGPFVKLNAAAISESLFESEVFGHERGAFTGATGRKTGLLEAAQGGTLFLDEIGELPLTLQAKLLRVLETRVVLRVGAVTPVPIDVRFVSATNRDLEAAVARGTFREDLYFRLNGISLAIPPLRERVDEIENLATLFAAESGESGEPSISDAALDLLESYDWPGNVRELRNIMKRAALLAGGGEIDVEHLPADKMSKTLRSKVQPTPDLVDPGAEPLPPLDAHEAKAQALKDELRRADRDRLVAALEQCAGNQTKAARLLGISRRALVDKMTLYNLPRPRK